MQERPSKARSESRGESAERISSIEQRESIDFWIVTRYTKPQRSTTVPTISHEGRSVENLEDKAKMLIDISSPAPTPYDGGEGQECPPGRAYLQVDENLVRAAFQGTSSKKSPGPERYRPLGHQVRVRLGAGPDRGPCPGSYLPRSTPAKRETAGGVTIPSQARMTTA